MKNNYKNQLACSNCYFALGKQDDPNIYCVFDGTIAGRLFYLDVDEMKDYQKQYYLKWIETHIVSQSGICDDYQQDEFKRSL